MSAAVGSVVSDEEVVDELRAAWAQVSQGYARCWAAMTEVARRTTSEWETAEIAAALTFTTRRADYELRCAQALIEGLPLVYAALAAGELDHHKARVFTDYLSDVTPAQAQRICARLVPVAPGWTTGQLAARLLREVAAIDPDYTRRSYQRALRERGVQGYLDHTGTAVLSGSGLPAAEAAAAAARLEALADELRAAGYPATVNQARADLFLRLLDGTLEGLSGAQILATMLHLGPLAPADTDPHAEPSQPRTPGQPDQGPERDATAPPAPTHHPEQSDQREQSDQAVQSEQPAPEQPAPEQAAPAECPDGARQPGSGCADRPVTSRPVPFGVEVRVRLSTLLGLDEHPAELPGWGPTPAPAARDLVAVQHRAEWRIAIVDSEGYLLHGDLTRRRPGPRGARGGGDRVGGIVEIALPASMIDEFPTLAVEHPAWARVLAGITGSWAHREQARAALDQHPHRRFAHAALRRHVQMRDRHCVGVGCRRRAASADLDHTRDHAHGGPTITTNNGPNCPGHHGWSARPARSPDSAGSTPSRSTPAASHHR